MEVKTIGEMNFLVNGSNLEKFLYNLKSSSEDRFDDINIISKNSFKNVSTVENLTINTNSSLQIEQFAFENCSKLKIIVFDVKNNDLTIQSDAFKSCNDLDCVHIKSASKITIEKNAFSQCYNLRVVVLESDNVEIRDDAFESSNDLCIISKSDKKGNKKIEKYCFEHNFEYKDLK